jgi:DNA mismatch endonuclease (patch repair protein)
MGMSKRQIILRYGFNAHLVGTLLNKGVLVVLPGCSPLRPKIDPSTIKNLVEGEHYVVCRECGAYQAQITTKHLRACSGTRLAQYVKSHPEAQVLSTLAAENKAKTEEQRTAQSNKLKARFKTAEGEETRRQIAAASRRLHESGYQERAAAHLREINNDPERRAQLRQETQARWDSGELREAVEGWHRDNREASLASAANARRHIKRKRSKLHMRFKQAMLGAGILGFVTEYEVRFYAIDEAHPELKIAVEIDGCYFHGCPECGHPGLGENKALDRRKTTYLTRRGWRVVRFREHEINANIDACIEHLRKFLQQLGAA